MTDSQEFEQKRKLIEFIATLSGLLGILFAIFSSHEFAALFAFFVVILVIGALLAYSKLLHEVRWDKWWRVGYVLDSGLISLSFSSVLILALGYSLAQVLSYSALTDNDKIATYAIVIIAFATMFWWVVFSELAFREPKGRSTSSQGSSRPVFSVVLILVIVIAAGLIVYANTSSSIFNDIAFVTLLAAVLGSVATLAGSSLISQFQSPRLSVDFKSHKGVKPYLDVLGAGSDGTGTPIKFLRLVVANDGRSPAKRCETKLTWEESGVKQPFQVIPHWVRLVPMSGTWSSEVYSPITVNTKDNEELDLLKLVQGQQEIKTVSVREATIRPKTAYDLTVTVFSSNSNPSTLRFSIEWDGTWDGFNKSVKPHDEK